MIATTPTDIADAARRLAAGNKAAGIPTLAPDAETLAWCVGNGDIVAIAGTDTVLWAHEDEQGQWWVSHFYGPQAGRTAIRDTCAELVSRGFGAVAVKWQTDGPMAALARRIFGITTAATKGGHDAFTPSAGLARLP